MPDNDFSERVWERGYEGHELAQLRRLAKLSLREKIQWLEEAQEMVLHLQRAKEAKDSGQPERP